MEKIVTLFDSAAHAEAAQANLEAAGFSAGDISIDGASTLGDGAALRAPGFWGRLFGRDIEEYEASTYANAVANGGAVLTVRTNDVARAMAILNQHAVVDVKEKAVETKVLTEKAVDVLPAVSEVDVAVAQPVTTRLEKDDVIRLAEEQIAVGKKLYEEGSTRIRRYTVEKPVEASVSLHEEHVEVFRRAIDEPIGDDWDWGEATIEMRETAERPYVTKSARIVGEVGLKKTGIDTEQVIRDTVRKEEVEVEQVPATETLIRDEGIVGREGYGR